MFEPWFFPPSEMTGVLLTPRCNRNRSPINQTRPLGVERPHSGAVLAALAKISGAFMELPQLPKACTLLGEGKPCSVGPRSHVEAHSNMKVCCDTPNKPRAQPRPIPGEETGSTLGLVPPF